MTQDELNLLHGYLNGTIAEGEFARLQTMLRQNAEVRRTLRSLSTVDAKLEDLARQLIPQARPLAASCPARSRYQWLVWASLAAVAACIALVWGERLLTRTNSSKPRPDIATAISSTQSAIARFSVEPTSPFPAWASPTDSLLDQPRFTK